MAGEPYSKHVHVSGFRFYNSGVSPVVHPGSFYGQGTRQIWMDNVTCTGVEDSLSLCSFPGWGVANCEHDREAGVDCYGGDTITSPTLEPGIFHSRS